MSGMKRTGWVSKSVIILKMVTSLRFWRMGTLTSTTKRGREGGKKERGAGFEWEKSSRDFLSA